MRHLALLAGALALATCSASPAFAQDAASVRAPAGFAPVQAPCVKQADASCLPVSAAAPLPIDTIVRASSVDRGALVSTTAVTLMPANSLRRGYVIQNQSASASCYINGLTTASTDWHSLLIPPGGYYETPSTHVGGGVVSVICTGASTPVFVREW